MSSYAISVVGGAFVALLVAGYLAQKSLPPPAPKLVGIDLGTTYSCIGSYQAITGNVIIYKDEDGHKCIPSVVAFSDGKVLVGYEAVAQQESNPKNTVYDAKRFIGKKFTAEQMSHEAKRYSFQMSLDEEGFVRFHVHQKKEDILVRPEEVGGHIVRTLVQTMQRNFSLGSAPKLAVVSVPAEFDERQRNYTAKALSIAGLQALRVINEPTAAALAYGLHKKSGVTNVLVVDLGGGTLDVSLLSIQGGMFLTMAMAGNNHLGGQDFNNQLLLYLLADIKRLYGRALTDPEDLQALSLAVEAAKINLTSSQTADVKLALHSLSGKAYERTVSRQEFETVNKDLFKKILEPIEAVLADTELRPRDVDEVVMVGGSTRIPRVRELVSKLFDNRTLNTAVDADLAVVSGVSIQAGIIGGMWPLTVSAVEVQTSVKKIYLD